MAMSSHTELKHRLTCSTDTARSVGEDVGAVRVSVIIPFRNPGCHFRGLMESLAAQELSEPWEAILVDNGSSDDSVDVAAEFSDRLRLRMVKANAKQNAAYARNVGVKAAKGDMLLFLDSDDQIASGYLQAMVDGVDSHVFVTSRVDSRTLNEEWVRDAHGPPWQERKVDQFFSFLPSAGINVAIPRLLFDAIGGFPEEFSGSQDVVFCWRIQLQTGQQIHFVPSAVYRYRFRHSLWGLFCQTRNWGYSNALLHLEFRDAGMPARSLKEGFDEWRSVIAGLLRARTRKDLATIAVRGGYCVGRLMGSIRYGVRYL